jgi:hypothetical protein
MEETMRGSYLALAGTTALLVAIAFPAPAGTEDNPKDFMDIHRIEIVFHEAGTTKNLDLMISLFADDATITSGGKTYTGKDQVRSYWQAAGPAAKSVGRLHARLSHQIFHRG